MAAAARRQGDSATDKNSKTKLSAALLNAELTKRPHKQRVIWDSKQPGLCVLISRGAKDAHRATVTFRVAFYLKNVPGKPQYVSLGRYPDGQYTYQDWQKHCRVLRRYRRHAPRRQHHSQPRQGSGH